MPRPTPALNITPRPREALTQRPTSAHWEHQRAAIVLKRADGVSQAATARALGVSRPVVIKWERRFRAAGMAGLADAGGRGRKPSIGPEVRERITRGATQPPEGRTRWSVRSVARATGVSKDTVQRLWRANDIKPHVTRIVTGLGRGSRGPAPPDTTSPLFNRRDVGHENGAVGSSVNTWPPRIGQCSVAEEDSARHAWLLPVRTSAQPGFCASAAVLDQFGGSPTSGKGAGSVSTGRPRARSPQPTERRCAGGGKRGAGSRPLLPQRADPRQAGAAGTANAKDHIVWRGWGRVAASLE